MRIYVDLDNTLANPVLGGPSGDDVIRIEPRPGAAWFLRNLQRHGEPWLLTAGSFAHARRSLAILGPSVERRLQGVIPYESLGPIEKQIKMAVSPDLSDQDRFELWRAIEPIAPKGVVFDDFPVGSTMFVLKAKAVGIGPQWWIRVEPFTTEQPDQGGLRKAYAEFVSRFVVPQGPTMAGRRVAVWR
jgi:hypothetical protein